VYVATDLDVYLGALSGNFGETKCSLSWGAFSFAESLSSSTDDILLSTGHLEELFWLFSSSAD